MLKGLFINNKKAQDSIYESGRMVYDCLKLSQNYSLDYCEVDVSFRKIKKGFDFYFFNYHPSTMGWLDTSKLKKDLGFVVTMILEVAPNDAFVLCPKKHFCVYCALDPTIKPDGNLFPFPRPLEKIEFIPVHEESNIPIIGTFGFATKGKGFQHVVNAVNKEFDKAIVRINIPYGDFVPDSESYAKFLADLCIKSANPGIEVLVTHEYMTKEKLIEWCSKNTLNCFLYDRDMPGLSATTDQAIISERPMVVSENDTFRHIKSYLEPYPKMNLKSSINSSLPIIRKMKQDWSSEKFMQKFEQVIEKTYSTKLNEFDFEVDYSLPILNKNFLWVINNRFEKYLRKIRKFKLSKILKPFNNNELI